MGPSHSLGKVLTGRPALLLRVRNPRFHPGNGATPVGRLPYPDIDNPLQTSQWPLSQVPLELVELAINTNLFIPILREQKSWSILKLFICLLVQ